jgi:hypothetical protein
VDRRSGRAAVAEDLEQPAVAHEILDHEVEQLGDAEACRRGGPQEVAVVEEQVARDLVRGRRRGRALGEPPRQRPAPRVHEPEAVVAGEVGRPRGSRVAGEVVGRGDGHPAGPVQDAGDERRGGARADPQGDVDVLGEQVAHAIVERDVDDEVGVVRGQRGQRRDEARPEDERGRDVDVAARLGA